MSLNAVKILGISITTNSKKEILEYCQKYLQKKEKGKRQKAKIGVKPLIIVTPNPEQVVHAQTDKHFAQILNQADVALPDGGRLEWASRLIGRSEIRKRIPGVEFMEDLVQLAAERGYRVGLIGGWGGVAVEALECLSRRTPGLTGWAIEPEEMERKKIAQKIRQTNTRIVFVGLGAPKQELFVEQLVHNLQFTVHSNTEQNTKHYALSTAYPLIFMSVGGSFDIIAGRTPRAPLVIRSIGFEYVWRLFIQPWRLRRQLALLKFIWLVLWEKVRFAVRLLV